MNQATHNHKKMGGVIVLRSTEQLAEVQVPATSEHCWVKLTDLTKLGHEVDVPKSRLHVR